MANLVIKPASGSGNKVVFQNQAGNVDAITVEDSGAIAVAGNTTLSGTANNLGTVASMVLPQASATAVYPAGHIIQTEHMFTEIYKSHNGTDWTSTNCTDSITVRSATSNIIVMASLCYMVYPDSLAAWLRLDESTTSLSDEINSYYGAHTEELSSYASPIYKHDHNQAIGTTLTYTVMMRAQTSGGSGIRINDHFTNPDTTYSALLLMEIQA
jgi:hypothetical protein